MVEILRPRAPLSIPIPLTLLFIERNIRRTSILLVQVKLGFEKEKISPFMKLDGKEAIGITFGNPKRP
jgi:hypothetical protein